jgi:hypothetical protein
MLEWQPDEPWFHGSDQKLSVLRAGSSVTRRRDLARAFSHRPTLLVQHDDGRVQHDGSAPGYLYVVADELGAGDLYPHPHPVNVGHWEWLTTRQLTVRLVERTAVRAAEQLTEHEIAALRQMQQERGAESFAADEPPV